MVSEQVAAGHALVEFVRKFVEVQEHQLAAVRDDIQAVVEKIMNSIDDISKKTEEQARRADEVLVKTCTNPDAATKELVDSMQLAADEVFRSASAAELEKSEDLGSQIVGSDGGSGIDNKIRRLGGQFTKHMEAMSNLNTELKDLLFSMMGALSADDVIRQKLDHVVGAISGLHELLTSVAQAPEGHISTESVAKFKAQHLTDLYKSYTCEEEKEIFHRTFGKPVGTRKAAA